MSRSKWNKSIHTLLSASLVAGLVVPAIPAVAETTEFATDLIISEYVEGSSNNKALELYNGTGAIVDLSQYTIELYPNGAVAPSQKLKLSGTLEHGKTYVIVHGSANAGLKAIANLQNTSVMAFNGDDALVLRKSNQVVDSFGQVGTQVKWGENVTLVRKSSILSGDSIIDDSFDTSIEWSNYPIDTFEYLGAHEMGTGSPGDPGDPGETEITSIADARGLDPGTTVTIKGVVAANLRNTISVQDATGGIAVRPTSLNVKIGDEVTLTGKTADYRGLLQLDSATIVGELVVVGEPTAKVITGAEVNEANESLLVKTESIEILSVEDGGSWANYTATDGTTEFIVRDETNSLGLVVGNVYDSITGIVQQFDETYQVIPRFAQDVILDSTAVHPVIATPGSGTFVGGTTVTLTTSTLDAEILYTLDETDPIENGATYASPIEIAESTTLTAVVKTTDGRYSDVVTYDYNITDAIRIHDIQGEGHTSPFDGQSVEGIEGIVTYHFTLNGSNYYHIQTPDALVDKNSKTSEAIILFSGRNAWPIQVGDLVSVDGKVSEYAIDGFADRQQTDMKVTQINVRDDQGGKVRVLENNVELPAPIVIDEENLPTEFIDSDNLAIFNPEVDAIDFWESIEGMRVKVGNVKAVAPQEHGDIVTVLESAPTNTLHGGLLLEEDNANANRIQFRLEPNGAARDFEVATGDKFEGPITGVVGYSFQNYKIYTALEDMQAAHVKGEATPEQTTIVKAEDKLTIASYNLENFSNDKASSSDDKARKLARAFAVDMQSPDIVGVTEVQDNNGPKAGDSKANQSYERLIQAIVDAGGVRYKYVNIDPVNNQDGGQPDANIRVGFLYNPERVSLTAGSPQGDATTAVSYENGKLTHNPGRIDPTNSAFNSSRKPLAAQFDFQGENVIVIANHWNSKSGDTPLFGSQQPPVYKSEVQRKKIAEIVYGFVADVKTKNPEANIVSLGDFNDFQFAEALKIHEGNYMTNMINKVETSDRYTYVYQGNSQVLDHILVSNELAAKTKIDILHINADFTDMAGRASDHDPVLVQVNFGEEEAPTPIEAELTYNFSGLKTKLLKIGKPSVAVSLDETSVVSEGVLFTGAYAEFHGVGFATTPVTVKPAESGGIVDFKGNEAVKLVIDGTNVSEVRGAENIQEVEFINGANPENIKFYNSKGEPIGVPPFSPENNAPIITNPITNKTVTVGETVTVALNNHFADPDGDELSFTSTKGTVTGSTLSLTLEEGSHIVGVTATDGEKVVTASFTVTVNAEAVPGDDYYKNAYGKEGQALKDALHEIISDHTQLSYDQVWEALRETDEDPNNKNNVLLLYSGDSRSKTANGGNVGNWNREHVWAKSHGGFGTTKGPGTDIHHLRPTDVQINSTRGNLDFDNGGSPVKNCDGCKRSSNSWEPPDRVKGDVARMLFYMATRYEKGDRVDLELNEQLNNNTAPYHGKLSVLLEWHHQDPVDDYEMNRNNVIQKWQGNRNPFIDHPEWVTLIWKKQGSSFEKLAS